MTKKILSLTLTLLMLFSFMLPSFATGDTTAADTTAAAETENEGEGFNYEDADRAAVAAAKSKFIIDGLSAEEAGLAEKVLLLATNYIHNTFVQPRVTVSRLSPISSCNVLNHCGEDNCFPCLEGEMGELYTYFCCDCMWVNGQDLSFI